MSNIKWDKWTEEDAVEENIEQKKALNKVTSLLNDFEKDYEVKMWASGEGIDIIIHEAEVINDDLGDNLIPYKQVISVNDNGFVKFEKQEEVK